jgi:hypothetical protein
VQRPVLDKRQYAQVAAALELECLQIGTSVRMGNRLGAMYTANVDNRLSTKYGSTLR